MPDIGKNDGWLYSSRTVFSLNTAVAGFKTRRVSRREAKMGEMPMTVWTEEEFA